VLIARDRAWSPPRFCNRRDARCEDGIGDAFDVLLCRPLGAENRQHLQSGLRHRSDQWRVRTGLVRAPVSTAS